MSFVSYAQNFEDVMLWRALKHVLNGVYVDVGAQHPVVDSVSKAFYDRGWRGVHIEPVLYYAEMLRQYRPDETVLQVALADTEGTLDLNVIPETGLSTVVAAYAHRHFTERGFEHQHLLVPVLTLKSALGSLAGKDVHWLKIDVEGFEEQVLKGWDSQSLRPWIMVVEATIPNSPETNYAGWDSILTVADYLFVYFDGLNRFYVAKEHAELIEAFSCPPNVFDGVQLSGLASSELCQGLIAAHQESEKELNQRIVSLDAALQTAREHEICLQTHSEWLQNEWDAAKAKLNVAEQLSQELQNIYASKSWRVAVQLRLAMLAVRRVLALPSRTLQWALRLLKRLVKPLAVWGMRQTLGNFRLKAFALGMLAKHPRLKQHLRQFAMRSGLIAGQGMASSARHPFQYDLNMPLQ